VTDWTSSNCLYNFLPLQHFIIILNH
jgi:hypothetical protein